MVFPSSTNRENLSMKSFNWSRSARRKTTYPPFKVAKARLVERFERKYLIMVLADHAGNITKSANAAGLNRVHLLRLLDRYGLRESARRTAALVHAAVRRSISRLES